MLNKLKDIGLSEKEAKIYLSMLELGSATVLEISRKAEINRPTAYLQIESLKKRGLVSCQTKGRKQLFMAESPEQLDILLEREKKILEQKQDELKEILPELEILFRTSDSKPVVRFFEGKEGLMRMQEDFLKVKSKEILAISSPDDVYRVFPDHPTDYSQKRIKKDINSRVIYTSEKGDFLAESDKKMLRESKFVPKNKFPFTVDITIYDDKVAIASVVGNISGTIIEHKEVAYSFRGLFELIWSLHNFKT